MEPAVEKLLNRGAHLVPLAGKTPCGGSWLEPWQVNMAPEGCDGWGVVPASLGMLVIDVDEESYAHAIGHLPPSSYAAISSGKGWHIWVKWPARWGDQPNRRLHGVEGDLRHGSGYVKLWHPDDVLTALTAVMVDEDVRDTVADLAPTIEPDEDNSADGDIWDRLGRNNALNKLIFSEPNRADEFAEEARKRGLSESEIRKTVYSAKKAGRKAGNHLLRNAAWDFDPCSEGSWVVQCPLSVRYIGDLGKWYQLGSNGWEPITEHHVQGALMKWAWDLAEAGKLGDKRSGLRWLTIARARAIVQGLRTRESVYTVSSEMDPDPNAVGLPNGETLNLRTGERTRSSTTHIVRKLGCIPEPDEPKRWLAFLNFAIPDPETREWIRAFMLYSLSGHTTASIFTFLYGAPGSGKSTIARALLEIAGQYGVSINADNLTEGQRHPTWLMALATARTAIVEEIRPGRWSPALKAVISGDRISARRMRQDETEITPTAKVLITGNQEPSMPAGDGLARRMALINMDEAPDEPDYGLHDAISVESGQILTWVLGGTWLTETRLPTAIARARLEYVEDSDPIAGAVKQMLRLAPFKRVNSKHIIDALQMNGELSERIRLWPARRFYNAIRRAGFADSERTNGVHWILGAELVTGDPSADAGGFNSLLEE